jgi:predicted site-specific integrase-resolvase
MIKQKMLLKPREVVLILGVSKRTLFRWTQKGILHFVRLPTGDKRYYRREIEEILQHRGEFRKLDKSPDQEPPK